MEFYHCHLLLLRFLKVINRLRHYSYFSAYKAAFFNFSIMGHNHEKKEKKEIFLEGLQPLSSTHGHLDQSFEKKENKNSPNKTNNNKLDGDRNNNRDPERDSR